jgi:hypothetical protein
MPVVTTEAEVCNLALAAVGQRQFIDRLDEATTEAQVCAELWRPTYLEVLQAFMWRFATKRAELAQTTETRAGWAYCYRLPGDAVLEAPMRLWSGRSEGEGDAIPFEIELNDAGSGHLVLANVQPAILRYVTDVRTVALWPPAFVKAVAARLAVCLAGALPVKPEMMPMLERAAEVALARAKASSANAAVHDIQPESRLIRERG